MQYKIYGCKVNKYFLNLWLNYFKSIGKNDENSIIIATCVVTDRAKTKRLKDIIKNLQEGKHIYITGCANINKGNVFEKDIFFDIYKELKQFENQITLLGQKPNTDRIETNEEIYTKKFVVIQNGCDTNCSFCLTVLKRGKSYSIPQDQIIDQINDFEKSGGKEIVLTGINLAAYGCVNTRLPKTTKFNELLKTILKQTNIQRIRISSLGPEFLDDEFFEIISDKRFLPHFHFSIQSFSDKILRSMNRNYTSKTLEYVLSKIKNLNRDDNNHISIGADIIVGFPGETDEDFQQTIDGVQAFGINKLHVFPFSAHAKYESVPASDLPDKVKRSDIKEREKKLIEIGDKIRKIFIDNNIGADQEILVEEMKDGKWIGWSGNYIQVKLEGNHQKGEISHIIIGQDNILK